MISPVPFAQTLNRLDEAHSHGVGQSALFSLLIPMRILSKTPYVYVPSDSARLTDKINHHSTTTLVLIDQNVYSQLLTLRLFSLHYSLINYLLFYILLICKLFIFPMLPYSYYSSQLYIILFDNAIIIKIYILSLFLYMLYFIYHIILLYVTVVMMMICYNQIQIRVLWINEFEINYGKRHACVGKHGKWLG